MIPYYISDLFAQHLSTQAHIYILVPHLNSWSSFLVFLGYQSSFFRVRVSSFNHILKGSSLTQL